MTVRRRSELANTPDDLFSDPPIWAVYSCCAGKHTFHPTCIVRRRASRERLILELDRRYDLHSIVDAFCDVMRTARFQFPEGSPERREIDAAIEAADSREP